MVRYFLIILLLFGSSSLFAEIYRWVDPDGQVHFSDRPQRGSERIDLPVDSKPTVVSPEATGPETPDALYLGPYSFLEIVAPEPNETITRQDKGVSVSLIIDPPLIDGQKLSVLLDDATLPVENDATQFMLTGASLGSHRLQIRITGSDGRTVAQSAPRRFHIRQPKEPGQLR